MILGSCQPCLPFHRFNPGGDLLIIRPRQVNRLSESTGIDDPLAGSFEIITVCLTHTPFEPGPRACVWLMTWFKTWFMGWFMYRSSIIEPPSSMIGLFQFDS